jgi:acyl carrier protein
MIDADRRPQRDAPGVIMDSIEARLRTFLAENILFRDDGYPFSDETSFLESGTVDSMNIMEIVLFAEEAFKVKIADHEIVPANFDSVRNLSEFIRRKQAASG